MRITRRFLLYGAALGGVGIVAACGTVNQQQATQLQSLIAGAQSIETSMASVVPALLALPQVKLTPAETTAIKAAMNGLTAATNALAQVPTIAAGATYVQVIESCLNVIVGIAATIPVIPEPYHTSLVVAALALPPLEALVGLAVQQGTALYATIKAKQMNAAPIVPPPVNAPLVPPPSAVPTGG